MSVFTHDPSAVLDYAVDWSAWLADGEVIASSTWTVPEGMEQATPPPSHTDTKTTVWVTGGTAGTRYRLTNRITTSQGRTDERSIHLNVVDR